MAPGTWGLPIPETFAPVPKLAGYFSVMKMTTREEINLRIRINEAFHRVLSAAQQWTPPSAVITMIREAAACRLSDPHESFWLARHATDLMNENLGMAQLAHRINTMIDEADLDLTQRTRTRLWVDRVRVRHQTTLNRVPIDWMHANQR